MSDNTQALEIGQYSRLNIPRFLTDTSEYEPTLDKFGESAVDPGVFIDISPNIYNDRQP
ncbi:hypothetical protein WDW37_10980 [Bdellovibrionota bacterium FG-1]